MLLNYTERATTASPSYRAINNGAIYHFLINFLCFSLYYCSNINVNILSL